MTKEELITKQQLEIEGLKAALYRFVERSKIVQLRLIAIQQCSANYEYFYDIAMNAAVLGAKDLEDIIEELKDHE